MPQVTRSRWVLQAKRVDSGITDRLVNQRPMEARNSASTISAIFGASRLYDISVRSTHLLVPEGPETVRLPVPVYTRN